MNLQQVRDFLNNVKDGPKTKVMEVLENDQQTIGQIIQFLMASHTSNEVVELVYSSLFTLYQNGGDIQKAFVLHFLPALVWEYLFISSNHGQKGYGKLEAVLLAIYNAEVLDENGKTKYQKFRLPSLSRPSLYHEPSLAKSGTSALTESALSRHEQSEVVYKLDGPGRELTRIPACHRFAVVAFVLEQYNHYIAFMGESSLEAACKMALMVSSCGFKDLCVKKDTDKDLEKLSECSRIPLDNATLVQLVYFVYYSLYNGFSKPARCSFDALHFRAEYGLFSQAYLHLLETQESDIAPLGLDMLKVSGKN
ncbi:LOW QUALITY PROTEIN: hyccin-like [Dendronephthya gigantea]|uniref:LOW QUALITY PROTEIN: hyccin-like n=1 Tax=Dendronephthya gigantea TaxID=151771 RepID=UPI00106D3176|nr:LOW QUALITY PROTEIN: hyccin-like [Dendronephthya gigantea]